MKFLKTLLFILLASVLQAQQPEHRSIEREKWERAVDGKDYREDPPKEKEQEETDLNFPEPNKPFNIAVDWMKILVFAAIAALLVYILWRLFGKGLFGNKNQKESGIRISDLEDKPMESDLDRFLREAIDSKNYRLAVRIYYLMLLKALQDHGFITWKKNKTNFDYLKEVSNHPDFPRLNNSTQLFEFVWYGERAIGETQFRTISHSFHDLIQKITAR